MDEKLKVYLGNNDATKFIKTRFGKRFFVIKDNLINYLGLFDFNFLNYTIMNNSDEEKGFNLEIISKARGDVLIAGLGIGLIVLPIMNKENVISIDIVEKYQEIIDLIEPQLPLNGKVNIIHQDIISFVPTKKYDIIYFDTLPEVQYLEDDKKDRIKDGKFVKDSDLTIDFRKYLKRGGETLYYYG